MGLAARRSECVMLDAMCFGWWAMSPFAARLMTTELESW